MKRPRLGLGWALALPVVATLLSSAPAGAFVRTSTDGGAAVRWSRPCVTLTAHVGSPPANLTADMITSAAQAAAAAWSTATRPGEAQSCSGFRLEIETS